MKSKIAYVVTHHFLEMLWERAKYEDLLVLISGMTLSIDGAQSMDPAMVYDWDAIAGGKDELSVMEGFILCRAYLNNWYEIGPQGDIKAVIDSMAVGVDGRPVNADIEQLWNLCWQTVCENVQSGEPLKTMDASITNSEGQSGRLDRDPDTGFLGFIKE